MKQVLIPLLAALFYGGWAAYSNFEHGMSAWGMAGLVQALFAFTSTLLLALCVAWFMARQRQKAQQSFLAHSIESEWVMPRLPLRRLATVFVQASSLLVGIPGLLHYIVGTPDALQAMLPGLIIGNGYLLILIRQH